MSLETLVTLATVFANTATFAFIVGKYMTKTNEAIKALRDISESQAQILANIKVLLVKKLNLTDHELEKIIGNE